MKSQVSLEFLIGVGFLLIIYIATIGAFSYFSQNRLIEKEDIQQACYTVSTGIDSATIGGEGFSMNVTMPYVFDKEGNFLTIIVNSQASIIDVISPKTMFSCSIISQNVTNLTMYAGKFSLNNINKTIYISAVLTDKLYYNVGETVHINGSYYLNNVSLTILHDGVPIPGYPKEIKTINNSFSDTFVPNKAGRYIIKVNDISKPTFYAEREIDVK